jgi:hypothetical protein
MLWSILASWITVGIVIPVLIGIGVGVMSMSPPDFVVAKAAFCAAALVLAARVAWWLGMELPADTTRTHAVIFAFTVFGGIGALWIGSLGWVDGRRLLSQPKQAATHKPTTTEEKRTPGTADAVEIAREVQKLLPTAPRLPTQRITPIFKASSLFTVKRKRRITEEINTFYRYIRDLGFDILPHLPPIGTDANATAGSSRMIRRPAVIYESELYLPGGGIDDARSVWLAYAEYVFMVLFKVGDADWGHKDITLDEALKIINPDDGKTFQWIASHVFATYYSSSFGNHRVFPDDGGYKWANALWEVRERHGKPFVDRVRIPGEGERDSGVKPNRVPG